MASGFFWLDKKFAFVLVLVLLMAQSCRCRDWSVKPWQPLVAREKSIFPSWLEVLENKHHQKPLWVCVVASRLLQSLIVCMEDTDLSAKTR